MATKVRSGFLFYIFLIIAFLACIAIFIAAGMVFFEWSLFGMSFFSFREEIVYETVSTGQLGGNNELITTKVDFSNLLEIRIEVTSANVYFVSSGDVKSYIKVKQDTFGFSFADDRKDFDIDIKVVDRVLTIKYKNPSGWAMVNNTEIYLNVKPGFSGGFMVPETPADNFDNAKLAFISTSGNLTIGGNEHTGKNEVGLKEISSKTENGKVHLDKYSKTDYEFLSFVTDSGDVTLSKEITAKSITFESKSAKFQTKTSTWKSVTDFSKYVFDIKTPSLSLKTNTGIITLGNIKGDVYCDSTLGNISSGAVEGRFIVDEKVKNTNFTLGRIHGELLIPDAEGSNVYVGEVYGPTSIKTKTGKVTIKQIFSFAEITTTSGDIDVLVGDKAGSHVSVNTETGRVKAHFNQIKDENIIRGNNTNIEISFWQSMPTGWVLYIENVATSDVTFAWDNPHTLGTITGTTYRQEIPAGASQTNNITVKASKISFARTTSKKNPSL